MLIERIIFNLIAVSLFIIVFFRIIKKNDTNYIILLLLQAISIGIGFVCTILKIEINIVFLILSYLLGILLPIFVFFLERKNINLLEIIYISIAKLAINMENTKLAKNILIKLVTKYPNSAIAHKMLGQIYEKEGGMRKAIDEYVKAIDLNKKDYDTYYKISFLLSELNQKEESAIMLQNLLKIKPDYYKATQLLGDILCEQEKYKEALNIYTDALRFNPNSFEIYYNMGMVYTMLNDFGNAENCYKKAADINNLLYNSYYNLAQINLIFNDLDEAERHFEKVIDQEDIDYKAYFYLAKIYMLRKDKENAIKFLNIAMEIEPTIIEKIEEEPAFIPLKGYLRYPVIDEEYVKTIKLSKKEQKAQHHLETTYKLVGKISRNDLKINTIRQINIEQEKER